MPIDSSRPTSPGERILALDVIRGFAMVGVLVAYCVWSLGKLQTGLIVPLCLALSVFALQLPLSLLWLRRFGFGPAEWVWRRPTYGKRPTAPRAAERLSRNSTGAFVSIRHSAIPVIVRTSELGLAFAHPSHRIGEKGSAWP